MLRFGKSERDFEAVYNDYSGGIHRTLKGMTGNDSVAEELTQEAFLKAWKGLPQFGFKSSIKTWLYQVAINVGRDWLRSHKSISLSLDEIHEESVNNSALEQKAIHEALLEMDEDSRTILILSYWEGLKQEEMSHILKVPEGTVKSRLFTAKSRLREILLMKGFDV